MLQVKFLDTGYIDYKKGGKYFRIVNHRVMYQKIRIRWLHGLGFEWSVVSSDWWNEPYKELVSFVAKNGDGIIPKSFPENPALLVFSQTNSQKKRNCQGWYVVSERIILILRKTRFLGYPFSLTLLLSVYCWVLEQFSLNARRLQKVDLK